MNRRSAPGTRSAPDADSQRFSGELAYHLFDRPALRTMILPAAAAATAPTRRGGPHETTAPPAATEALFDATALLRPVASDQLAEALD